MKLEIQNRDDHQVQLTAEVEAEILSQYLQRAARQIARESKIPGFRPGKAPFDIVQRLYGEEFIQKQALDLLIDDTYPKVIEDAKIDPSGPGTLEKVISVNPPIFSFIIPLAPEVELGDYRSIRLEYEPKPITDNDVDQVLRRLQRRSATAEPVERAAQSGDLVYIKLGASFAEPALDENAVLFEETPYQAVVGEENPDEVEWPFPGFSQQLAGLAANDEKTIPHTYPQDTPYT
ncbi:MAG: trigger factor, partial [Anaerolineaceae bacterium]|nr:trigger factor [Anaerolineaceae bacterium]